MYYRYFLEWLILTSDKNDPKVSFLHEKSGNEIIYKKIIFRLLFMNYLTWFGLGNCQKQ